MGRFWDQTVRRLLNCWSVIIVGESVLERSFVRAVQIDTNEGELPYLYKRTLHYNR